jgi:16S rRNA G966 N2-methylase RsmD
MTTLPAVRTRRDALALLDQGRRLLALARSAGDAKQLRDQAAAVERYLRQQKYAEGAALDATELKVRAERRVGELLGETVRPGGNGSNQHEQSSPRVTIAHIPDSVSRNQSSKWQRVAALPDDVFEQEVAAGRERGDLSTGHLLRAGGQEVRRRQADDARRRMAAEAPPTDLVRAGDFREALADLPDGSVSLIFTDPPYDDSSVPLYGDLARHAARWLKPGGSLLAYAGQHNLLRVGALMEGHLRYWWLDAVRHRGKTARMPGKWVIAAWKPVVWFVRGGRYSDEYLMDVLPSGQPDKLLHDWEQHEMEAGYLVEKLTEPGETVLDPMCGSGTTLVAALKRGRQALGCEIDPERAKVAAARVAGAWPAAT